MKLDVSTEIGYDIAAALRGPDVGFPTLKYIVTGWIRAQVGVSRGWVRRTEELNEATLLRARAEVKHLYAHVPTRVGMRHWVLHATLAIDHLDADHWLQEFTHSLKDLMEHPTEESLGNVIGWLDAYAKY